MDSLKARVFALALPAIGLFVSGPAVDATASETNQIPAVTDGVAVTSSEALLQSEAEVASTPSLNFVRRMSAADFERARSAAQTEAAQLPAAVKEASIEPQTTTAEPLQDSKAADVSDQVMVVDATPDASAGSLVSYDEPVIHVARKEAPPTMKQDFYQEQLQVAQESEAALELRPATQNKGIQYVADTRSTTVETPLRQPGTYNYPVTNVGPAKAAAAKPTQSVVKRSVAQPKANGGWAPVDIRTVNVSNQTAEAEVHATQATASDKAQAQKAVQLGFELIQRRAHYSARARFVQALRVIARSLDDQTFSTRHTTALRNALAAYEEAVDFYPTSAKPDEDVNLFMVLGGHKTPVLANADAGRLTPRQCVREYMAYAEQEFTMALGNDGFASQALYGLGRLEASKDTASTSAPQVRANRSLMLYQTSILVDQRNYAAANELGVLLARYGKFDNAVSALQHCVKYSPEPTAWKNLANIYRRVGKTNEARIAESQASRTLAAKPRTPFVANQPKVEWVKADAFMAMNADSNMQVTRTASLPNVATQPAVTPSNQVPVRGSLPTKTANRKSFWPFGGNK